MTRPLVGLEEHLVGHHIQLLLGLSLDVLRVRAPQHAREGPMIDEVGNDLAGGDDVVEQGGEVPGGALDAALLFDNELGDGRSAVVHLVTLPCVSHPPLRDGGRRRYWVMRQSWRRRELPYVNLEYHEISMFQPVVPGRDC